MACLAGTVDAPRRWVRFAAGEPVELEGRPCTRQADYTNRRACSSCPAYRGTRWDSTEATGIAPNGTIIALSDDEYRRYNEALEATFDDDYTLIDAWQKGMEGGLGKQILRSIGDPDATDAWNAYMRSYRARMTDDQREHQREQTRERVRRFRARNVNEGGTPSQKGK